MPDLSTNPPIPEASTASPFLETLMGLQSRLNDVSRMNSDLGLQCHQDLNRLSQEPVDPHKVQHINPRLSEQVITVHQVQMLNQHIKSLTSQVRKLQESIIPSQSSKSSNLRTGSTQSRSAESSPDDSSTNTRSTPSNHREQAATIEEFPDSEDGSQKGN